MSTIGLGSSTLSGGGAARLTTFRTAAESLSSAVAPADRQAPARAPEEFDFRHMSSEKLDRSMSAIVAAGHLSPDQQIMLGVGFVYNRLTAVGSYSPDKAGESQDILAGLSSFIDGDLSRGDQQGAAGLSQLLSVLTNLQAGHDSET